MSEICKLKAFSKKTLPLPLPLCLSLSFIALSRLSFFQTYLTCHFLPFIVNPFCGQRVTFGATADTCTRESTCTRTCMSDVSRWRDRLTCCNLEAVYCYKPCRTRDHRMCIAKRHCWKRYTRSLILEIAPIEDLRTYDHVTLGEIIRTCMGFHGGWTIENKILIRNVRN